MDNSIRLPTGHRIGIDGIIGLIPGFGDLAGAVVSSYMLLSAYRLGVPKVVLGRMGVNIGVETIFGAVPVLGDLFDFVFKANARNYKLLETYLGAPRKTRAASGVTIAAIGIGLLIVLVAGIVSVVALFAFVWRAVFG